MTAIRSTSGKLLAIVDAEMNAAAAALVQKLGGKILDIKGAGPDDMQAGPMVVTALFEYLIGNTDYSMAGLHNIELFTRTDGSDPVPVARDFDFAGIVNTRYATPDPRLHIRTVRDRLFRGYCAPDAEYPKAFAVFDTKKDAIYALYHDKIGALLQPKIVDETTKYLDDFYKTIDTPKNAKSDIVEACLKRGG